MLERELAASGPRNFDVLALDAFSSDAIPVHLLTREAFSTFRAHLREPGGILAVHITNRYLDLEPVVRRAALDLGFTVRRVDSPPSGEICWRASWMLLAATANALPATVPAEPAPAAVPLARPWTDDWSNLLEVLHKRGSEER